MKSWKHFIFLSLLCATAAQAQPQKHIWVGEGPDPMLNKVAPVTPMGRIVAIRKTLPVPADWHFFLLSEAEWNKQGLGTHSAYSNLAYKTTFVRESYAASAQDVKLRHTIAHEMGHRICGCTDENTADRIADELTR